MGFAAFSILKPKITKKEPIFAHMNVCVVGTGYVGLVTATCLAETGNHIVGVDIDEAKVARMLAGEVPIYEPGLESVFSRNLRDGRLRFSTSLAEGVAHAELIFLALPTPPMADGSADLKFVLEVATQIGPMIAEGQHKVIINKSTVPVGTGHLVAEKLAQGAKGTFDVVSNPEFLREGVAVDDFMKPERVVIGAETERARRLMDMLYSPFVRQGNPIMHMDIRSAEMTKYAANSFLATKITFMNEVANVCERLGADVDQVRRGIGADSRIGKRFLFPGVGYGGSCFPKDVNALLQTSRSVGYPFRILEAVVEVNNQQRLVLVHKLEKLFGNLSGKTIALWGLSFKPNTDDTREAPALYTIYELQKRGATVRAFDPEAMPGVQALLGDTVYLAKDEYEALQGADALAIATEWSVFRTPDFNRIKTILKQPIIIDGRNLYDLQLMEDFGFHYESVGRRVVG